MSFAWLLERRIGSFVHPDVLSRPADCLRHQTFILRRLVSSFAILCLMPLFLAAYGVPAAWQAAVFVLFLLPIGAVVLVSRTGHLVAAQALCVASFIGAALIVATAGGPWQVALVCLAFAPFEGVFSQNRALVLAGGISAGSVAAGLALAAEFGFIERGFASGHSAIFLIAAITYATALAYGIVAYQERLSRSEALNLEHYRAVYDALRRSALHHDRNGGVEYVGQNCYDLFGIPEEELTGRGLFERIHVADRPAFLKAIADAAPAAPMSCRRRCACARRARPRLPRYEPMRCSVSSKCGRSATASRPSGEPRPRRHAVPRCHSEAKLREEELQLLRTPPPKKPASGRTSSLPM